MPPTPTQIASVQHAVQNASAGIVADATYRLKDNHFTSSRWVGKKNRYIRHTIDRIRFDATNSNPRKTQLSEYLAASVFLHCSDGWSFLSNAVNALLNGDMGTAVHLAYYAELRAVMSFLASEGIGVFDNNHFWFDNSGSCHLLKGPRTHDMVWLAVDSWARVPMSRNRLLDLFTIEGRTFVDWLTATPIIGTMTVSALASEWLQAWSIDLKVIAKDQHLRNEVSYRPQGIVSLHQDVDFNDTLTRLVDYWKACEPSFAGMLGLLDLHLLRRALEQVYKARTGGSLPLSRGYASFIDNTLTNLAIPHNQHLRDFLLRRQSRTDHPLLAEARKKSKVLRPLSVIARAILILRVASAAVANLIQQNSIDRHEMDFWWSGLGMSAGLWEPDAKPERMSDLWEDIDITIDSIDDWLESPAQAHNIFQTRQNLSLDLWKLTQFQRAGLWAIGL